MTFISTEQSTYDGLPRRLYRIANANNVYGYTNALSPIVYNSQEYLPTVIRDSETLISGSLDQQEIEINVPFASEVGNIWKYGAPSDVVELDIFKAHKFDVDQEYITAFKGRLIYPKWTEDGLQLFGESIITSMRRGGLRPRYQFSCGHALYDSLCRISELDHELVTSPSAVNGNVLTVAAAALEDDNYYSGGFLTWQNSETFVIEKRSIISQIGSTITMDSVAVNLIGGQELKMYPGCDKTIATCVAKFNNKDNYGGRPYTPRGKNPFDGMGKPAF